MDKSVAGVLRKGRDRLERLVGVRLSRESFSSWIDHRIASLLQSRVKNRIRHVDEMKLHRSFQGALELLLDQSNGEPIGDYLEFGVYNGTSMICMHQVLRELKLDGPRLIGFDSFEGLPSDEEGVWRAGDFKSSLEFTQAVLSWSGVDWSRVVLVKGFFEDTLNASLAKQHEMEKAAVIMIDCDIYAGARDALEFCAPMIRNDAVIVFDDWHSGLADQGMGEKRAFDELLGRHPEFSSTYLEGLSDYTDAAAVFHVRRTSNIV